MYHIIQHQFVYDGAKNILNICIQIISTKNNLLHSRFVFPKNKMAIFSLWFSKIIASIEIIEQILRIAIIFMSLFGPFRDTIRKQLDKEGASSNFIKVVLLIRSITGIIVYSCFIHGVNHNIEELIVPALAFFSIEALSRLAHKITVTSPVVKRLVLLGRDVLLDVLSYMVLFSAWQHIKEENE